ncbi:unnamed protein product [Kuraishia capsulata CBS 1993]|uniref:Uncharacterized protein n=1 Tax=Kuraishia capsulata CBS 1993 TaxID=1382522 RepID=W6MFP1_9ASCO|nr:uncharacterized protein KUCA_T00000650001 [Kuraishia capsulata CBS 1993]CDK24684.1 unnamed protein product [Kuraishia capsulata CBS 1993]
MIEIVEMSQSIWTWTVPALLNLPSQCLSSIALISNLILCFPVLGFLLLALFLVFPLQLQIMLLSQILHGSGPSFALLLLLFTSFRALHGCIQYSCILHTLFTTLQ